MHAKLILLVLACLSVAAALQSNKKTEALFEQFIKDYDRHYLLAGEKQMRYQNFLDALERVLEKNGRYGAEYGINKFSDWSEEELANRKMVPISPEGFAESCLAPNVTKAAEIKESDPAAPTPTAFDWRTKGVVTPVKNQGQCGSCWTFSTTGNIESQYAISGKPLTSLSEQMIVDCSHACTMEDGQQVCNQGCNGGWMWTAMTDVVSWGGLETEKAYPYVGETETCTYNNKTATLFAPLANYTCIGENENQILLQLLARGPLSIAMNADLVEDYTSGIIDPNAWEDDDDGCDPTSLDHAVLIVGYGIQDGWIEDTPFWIIKNSWGADWGEAGYFRIVRGSGACGINEAVTCANLATTD